MKNRRAFFRTTTMVSVGTIFAPFMLVGKVNAETKSMDQKLANKLDLRSTIGNEKYVLVKGKVYDKAGVTPKRDAKIEVLLPDSGLFLSKKTTEVTTNEKGEYEFLLDPPKKEKGKAPRVRFNISHENTAYATELIVTNSDAHISDNHWVRNHQLGHKLFPKKENRGNKSVIWFNLSI